MDWFSEIAYNIKEETGYEVYWNSLPANVGSTPYFYLESTALDNTDTSVVEELTIHLIADSQAVADEDMWALLKQAASIVEAASKTLAVKVEGHTAYIQTDMEKKDFMIRLRVVRQSEIV